MLNRELILEHISPIEDPELRIGLVDLGLVYDVDVKENGHVKITMTLTSPMCPIGPELTAAVEAKVRELEDVNDVNVYLVFEPPWDPAEMASDAAKDELGIW